MITEPSSSFTAFILSGFRVAAARARLTVVEIDSIATALAGGFIDAEAAIAQAATIGVLDLLPTSSTIAST